MAYDAFFTKPKRGMVEVGCWAHARRHFHNALETDPSPMARIGATGDHRRIVGVAAIDAPAGGTVTPAMEGVFDLAKNPPDVLAAGAVAKVTPATGIVSVAGTAVIRVMVQSAAAGSTTARVRLTPAVAGTPTTMETVTTHHDHPVKHEPEPAGKRH